MLRHRFVIALALGSLALLSPPGATAQSPASAQAAANLRLVGPHPMRLEPAARSLATLPDSVVRERKDHTVAGLLIGAGVGFVAGWAFYDTLCEAVDNRCSDSRVKTLVIGTAFGGALGALAGGLGR
jgi:hypothetical protein